MGAADKAASGMKRRGADLFDAQVVQTPNGTDDIQDAVDGANFMKMNFLDRYSVYLGFRFS